MNCRPLCVALIALAASLLLGGCAGRGTTRHGSGGDTASRYPGASTASSPAGHGGTRLPESTGIAACEDYLASYKSCHLAAHIYAPAQLEGRYQAMRTSLLRDSQDPLIRPQLAARCTALATQLRQALHGRSCGVEPAGPASDGGP
jgi:hypothetical protein